MPIFSKRELEGYVCIDHKESPGLAHPMLGAGQRFEAPTYTCPYCQRVVIINPTRTRDRERCAKLDRFICDECGAKRKAGIDLVPFTQIIEQFMTAAAHGKVDEFITKTTSQGALKDGP